MKKLTILLLFIGSFSFSQDLVWDKEKSFDVEFEIDNVYSPDGINWEITRVAYTPLELWTMLIML